MSDPMRLYVKGPKIKELVLVERAPKLAWGHDCDQYATVRDTVTGDVRPLVVRAGERTFTTPSSQPTETRTNLGENIGLGAGLVVDNSKVRLVDVTVPRGRTRSIAAARTWGRVGVGTPYQEFHASCPEDGNSQTPAARREMKRAWEPVYTPLPGGHDAFAVGVQLLGRTEVAVEPGSIYYLSSPEGLFELDCISPRQISSARLTTADTGEVCDLHLKPGVSGYLQIGEEFSAMPGSGRDGLDPDTGPLTSVMKIDAVVSGADALAGRVAMPKSPLLAYFGLRPVLEQRAAASRLSRLLRSPRALEDHGHLR